LGGRPAFVDLNQSNFNSCNARCTSAGVSAAGSFVPAIRSLAIIDSDQLRNAGTTLAWNLFGGLLVMKESKMPKYLITSRYTTEGLRGLKAEGGTSRRDAVAQTIDALGGKLESMYFALGADDTVIIAQLPDNNAAAAFGLTVGATGITRTQTTPLITPEEADNIAKQKVSFRAPSART
jgi:uncharacterized protein with GYD domain